MQGFWEFVTHHWYFALPMFVMTFGAGTLVVWRFLLNMNAYTNLNQFLPQFQEKLSKEGIDGAIKLCKETPGLIPSKLYVAGLENAGQGLAAVKRAMVNVLELEILPQLNFLLPSILAIGKIATMVGLLGTVISMIGTFSAIQEAQGGEGITNQSREIGLALWATALGLITAIPLVFSHVLFKSWIANYELKMKYAAQKLVLLLQDFKAKPPASPAVPKSNVPVTASK